VGCAWLVRLLPELTDGPIEPLPAWTLPPEQERRLMVEAVLRWLANVAGPAGTLLVLDDPQCANPDALDLLTVLARSASEVPLRLLGAYRHTEVGPRDPLSVMLADLAQAGLATQHTLPLTPQETGQLLAGLLADLAGAEPELQQRVGGVPFCLVSCARALRAGAGAAIPWGPGPKRPPARGRAAPPRLKRAVDGSFQSSAPRGAPRPAAMKKG